MTFPDIPVEWAKVGPDEVLVLKFKAPLDDVTLADFEGIIASLGLKGRVLLIDDGVDLMVVQR